MPVSTRYFLGANSAAGFASLYDDWRHEPDMRFLYIIKGGPGCGKSSFMRRVASAALEKGLDTEYIQCSGDPSSLDGVRFPALGLAYVDGTPPHALEAELPGARSAYLDLGRFYSFPALAAVSDELGDLNRAYKFRYARAYRLLSAAGACAEPPESVFPAYALEACLKRANSIASREFGKPSPKRGVMRRRFLSAVSCDGSVTLADTVSSLCTRVYSIDNELSLAPVLLRRLAEFALDAGHDAVLCFSPLHPSEPEHLLIPALSLAFLSGGLLPAGLSSSRHIRLDSLAPRPAVLESRAAVRSQKKLRRELILAAEDALAEAKSLHDALEKLYNPHVDFDSLYFEAQKHAEML